MSRQDSATRIAELRLSFKSDLPQGNNVVAMPLLYGRSIARSLPVLGIQCSTRPQLLSLRSPQCPRFGAPSATLRSFACRGFATNKLDLTNLDEKWRRKWEELGSGSRPRANGAKGSQYILPMFPYPSGTLHVGHLRVYTIADVLARFSTLQGHDVLLPMGWDAFGLPAENAAIEHGVNPATWTKDNIAKMKVQLDKMNGSWDWSNVRSRLCLYSCVNILKLILSRFRSSPPVIPNSTSIPRRYFFSYRRKASPTKLKPKSTTTQWTKPS